MNYFIPFFILLFSACSTLMTPSSSKDALKPIKLEGEGRGRIGYFDQNYLFRFESVFRDKNWILSLTIPMHGQEVLVFEDLHKKVSSGEMQKLEMQIDQEIKKQTKIKELDEENIMAHLRSLVRFVEAQRLGLSPRCHQEKCILDEVTFLVTPIKDGVLVKKYINENYFVEFGAMYLENDSYSRTNFYLKKDKSKENLFSLELFWKNK